MQIELTQDRTVIRDSLERQPSASLGSKNRTWLVTRKRLCANFVKAEVQQAYPCSR